MCLCAHFFLSCCCGVFRPSPCFQSVHPTRRSPPSASTVGLPGTTVSQFVDVCTQYWKEWKRREKKNHINVIQIEIEWQNLFVPIFHFNPDILHNFQCGHLTRFYRCKFFFHSYSLLRFFSSLVLLFKCHYTEEDNLRILINFIHRLQFNEFMFAEAISKWAREPWQKKDREKLKALQRIWTHTHTMCLSGFWTVLFDIFNLFGNLVEFNHFSLNCLHYCEYILHRSPFVVITHFRSILLLLSLLSHSSTPKIHFSKHEINIDKTISVSHLNDTPELIQLRFVHVIESKSQAQIPCRMIYISSHSITNPFRGVHKHTQTSTHVNAVAVIVIFLQNTEKNVTIQFIR